MGFEGSVLAMFLTAEGGGVPQEQPEVEAVVGRGLRGDRYFAGSGTFDTPAHANDPQRHVTLIEAEAIEAARRDYEVPLGLGEHRRNIVTRGVPLNHLVDREFVVGEVRLRGIKLCEPCAHMEGLSRPGARRALAHRGGLRAQILDSGTIRVGDPITPV